MSKDDPINIEVWRRAKLVRQYLVEQCGQTVNDDRFSSIYEWNYIIYNMQLNEVSDAI